MRKWIIRLKGIELREHNRFHDGLTMVWAWFPVKLWTYGEKFTEPTGKKVWWKWVVRRNGAYIGTVHHEKIMWRWLRKIQKRIEAY